MIRRLAAASLLSVLALAPTAALAQDFPEFTNHVVDDADVVPAALEDQINGELADYQRRTDDRIAIALLGTIDDRNLENYSIDLAREWGIGDADDDNGVLLFLAIEDRISRIEVGSGLEGELTDIESGRILRGQMRDLLRQGEYGDAVLLAERQMRLAMGDEVTDVPPPAVTQPAPNDRNLPSFAWLVPLVLFGVMNSFGRRGRRRQGWVTPLLWGAGLGGLGGGRGGSGGFGGGFGGGGGGGFSGGGASGDW